MYVRRGARSFDLPIIPSSSVLPPPSSSQSLPEPQYNNYRNFNNNNNNNNNNRHRNYKVKDHHQKHQHNQHPYHPKHDDRNNRKDRDNRQNKNDNNLYNNKNDNNFNNNNNNNNNNNKNKLPKTTKPKQPNVLTWNDGFDKSKVTKTLAPTPFCKTVQLVPLHGANNDTSLKKLSIGTYNILAPTHTVPKFYPYAATRYLKWDFRRYRIVSEIAHANLDVVCLQECEYYTEFLEQALDCIGYTGVYCSRPTRSDGCAIIWKKDKFELAESKVVDFNLLAKKHGDNNFKQNCIGLLTLLKRKDDKEDDKLFCVATTHIYWKPTFTECKIRQVQLLLHEAYAYVQSRETTRGKEEETRTKKKIKRKKTEHGQTTSSTTISITTTTATATTTTTTSLPETPSIPIIVCGDFNIAPNSGIYEFITSNNGTMDFSSMSIEQAGARLGVDDNSSGKMSLQEISHPLHGLKSAYANYNAGAEPEYTTFAKRHSGTLDYIFFHPSRLHPSSLLSLPPLPSLKRFGGLPNVEWGSDHMILGCEFSVLQ